MKKAVVFILIFAVILTGCADTKEHSKGVYMLLDTDTSGTYALELKKAQSVLNYLLGILQPLDTLTVARIDTGSGLISSSINHRKATDASITQITIYNLSAFVIHLNCLISPFYFSLNY